MSEKAGSGSSSNGSGSATSFRLIWPDAVLPNEVGNRLETAAVNRRLRKFDD
jgi:hypothetical protein